MNDIAGDNIGNEAILSIPMFDVVIGDDDDEHRVDYLLLPPVLNCIKTNDSKSTALSAVLGMNGVLLYDFDGET